jgi:hypothetical protein
MPYENGKGSRATEFNCANACFPPTILSVLCCFGQWEFLNNSIDFGSFFCTLYNKGLQKGVPKAQLLKSLLVAMVTALPLECKQKKVASLYGEHDTLHFVNEGDENRLSFKNRCLGAVTSKNSLFSWHSDESENLNGDKVVDHGLAVMEQDRLDELQSNVLDEQYVKGVNYLYENCKEDPSLMPYPSIAFLTVEGSQFKPVFTRQRIVAVGLMMGVLLGMWLRSCYRELFFY